jgi:hypothetical protein
LSTGSEMTITNITLSINNDHTYQQAAYVKFFVQVVQLYHDSGNIELIKKDSYSLHALSHIFNSCKNDLIMVMPTF